MSRPIYAHSLPGAGQDQWETLDVHSAAVAELATQFASAFRASDWGAALGKWHDLGKWSAAFQAYIRNTGDPDAAENETSARRVDHATFGARHAAAAMPGVAGQMLAFCIAGHHAGLANATTSDDSSAKSTLEHRLDPARYAIAPVVIPPDFPQPPAALVFPLLKLGKNEVGFAFAFFTRMLFSALIDADRTATEAFCNKAQAEQRGRPKPTLDELRVALDGFLEPMQQKAPKSRVNDIRARVLNECLIAASLAPGFFSLNVPTGGGKTFASLAFALHHARHHSHLRRVVIGIPFTSIIEQTADQYRRALKELAHAGLVEHHSNLNPVRDTRENKLASENWDAPLIVTTNVELFESLFAAGTTPARKLHRLANSVIVLDEAQTIPIDLLKPTLAALRELVIRYGCTIVLCTATQPALEHRNGEFEIGLQNVRPIIQDPVGLHQQLKRVEIFRLGRRNGDIRTSLITVSHKLQRR